jgi:hypothetical protein
LVHCGLCHGIAVSARAHLSKPLHQ